MFQEFKKDLKSVVLSEYKLMICILVILIFCVVMFGLINVNVLYYSFSTLYQMCNLRQSL